MQRKKKAASIVVFLIIVAAFGYLLVRGGANKTTGINGTDGVSGAGSPAATGTLQVVAAENFWGSVAAQIGGTHARVLSLVSDPNADPHEFESAAASARAVAGANYVIENGAGYDSWMDKLLGAGARSAPDRKVLNVAALVGVNNGDNPHLWYSPDYVDAAAAQMEQDFAALDPTNAAYYETNYRALLASFASYKGRIASIKDQFGGARIAATEDVISYLARAAGLDLVSPQAFIQAVAEGNDPPAASIVQFQDQLRSGPAGPNGVKVLIYNEQTVTPLTENIKKLAASERIPTIAVTETIQPPNLSFQDWMDAQLAALQEALTTSSQ